jgi:hypothetical protein
MSGEERVINCLALRYISLVIFDLEISGFRHLRKLRNFPMSYWSLRSLSLRRNVESNAVAIGFVSDIFVANYMNYNQGAMGSNKVQP